MLQQAPLPSQHENPLKQDGFRVHRSRLRFRSHGPVQPGSCDCRPRPRGSRRPGMAEHQLHAHGKHAIGFAKRLVSRCSSPEGLDGRQSAPARSERARATAAAQDPAQVPEIGGVKSNPFVRPSPHPRSRRAPTRPPGHACRQMNACAAMLHHPPTRRRVPSMCQARTCSAASGHRDAGCAGTPPVRGRPGRTMASPHSTG